MSFKVRYSRLAANDLKNIYKYIAQTLQAQHAAKRLVNKIRNEVSGLQTMPERFPLLDSEPLRSMQLRKLVVENYLCLFLVEDSTVYVVRIFYGARNLENLVL